MNNNYLVTVYITTFNRPKFFFRALKSLINQTYKNIEILIVDDNSKNLNFKMINNFINNKKINLRYFKNKKNFGAPYCRNLAIKKAKGYFITGLDDDDYFHQDRIKNFINKWNEKDSNTIALCGDIIEINNKKRKKLFFLRKKKILRRNICLNNIIGNQIFVKTSIIKSINGFDKRLKILQDWDCWLRLLNKYKESKIEVTKKSIYYQDVSIQNNRITNNKIGLIKNSLDLMKKNKTITTKELNAINLSHKLKKKNKIQFIEFIRLLLIDKSLYNFKTLLKNLILLF